MNADTLRGMAVVAVSEAERLGRVADVLFEIEPLRVSALLLQHDGAERILGYDAVTSLGPDAIVARRPTDIEAGGQRRASRPGLDDIGQLKVVDEAGAYMGRITRVDVDPRTGAVSALDVRRGDVLGIGGETQTLAQDRLIAVGGDLLTVRGGPA